MSKTFSIALPHAPSGACDDEFASLAFGAVHPGSVAHHGLQPLGDDDSVSESWRAAAPVSDGRHGPIAWRANTQLLFGVASVPLGDDIAASTKDLYQSLFDCVQESESRNFLRIWHFLPHINSGAGDRECYRLFCVGRARAFDTHALAAAQLPAGTAIGARAGNELLVYFLAARTPGTQIENPRQVSAFAYPRDYGPRTPLFSRAVVWPRDKPTRLIVSGTASIVGHESRHADDLDGQLREIWCNLECLRERAGAQQPLALRIYVRRCADYPAIRAFLMARLPADAATIYLHADICRAELLVEIEGIYAMPSGD